MDEHYTEHSEYMMTDPDRLQGTPVWDWLMEFYATKNENLHSVADNFTYYLDSVKDIERGEFDYRELPKFTTPMNSLMHAGVHFGVQWERSNPVYVVCEENENGHKEFVSVFRDKENAAEAVTQSENYVYEEVTIEEKRIDNTLCQLEDANSDTLQNTAEYLRYLYEKFESPPKNVGTIIDEMEFFKQNMKWLLAYSVVFGQLWGLSEPTVYIVLKKDNEFVDVCTMFDKARNSQEKYQRTIAVTPIDCDTTHIA